MRAGFRRLILGEESDSWDRTVLPNDVRVRRDASGLRVSPGDGVRRRAAMVWFHGGGYVFGSPDTHLRPAARLAQRSGREVRLPAYPLAPESRWPAQLELALEVIRSHDVPPILVGDSAGGHLALVAALFLRREGRELPGLILFSPNTDRSGANECRASLSAGDPMVDDADDQRLFKMAVGEDFDPRDPQMSPLLDDLSGLPPTWIDVGGSEVLRDDSVLLQRRAGLAGASVSLRVIDGLLHMGQLWSPWWEPANESIDRMAEATEGL
ncbi:MAG: alpha/beta hydrolase [Chthoniobacterales bacterium]